MDLDSIEIYRRARRLRRRRKPWFVDMEEDPLVRNRPPGHSRLAAAVIVNTLRDLRRLATKVARGEELNEDQLDLLKSIFTFFDPDGDRDEVLSAQECFSIMSDDTPWNMPELVLRQVLQEFPDHVSQTLTELTR